MGQYGWALLVYYLILNFCVMAVCEIALMYHGFQAVIQNDDWMFFGIGMYDAMEQVLSGNGWGYLAACALTLILIPMWKGGKTFVALFENRRDMEGRSFLVLLCLFLSGQVVFQILTIVEELILNQFGLSVLKSMEAASSGVDTVSMFLYSAIAAPIVEEIVFRGVVMQGLRPYGKRFAIFGSALLFGLFHGNLVQSPYAFLVGLILGYTAMEYSLPWAMVLHMINNLVLGDMLPRLTSFLPTGTGDLLLFGILLAALAAGVAFLIRERGQIRAYRKANPIGGENLRAFFTSPPNVILAVIETVGVVAMLFL